MTKDEPHTVTVRAVRGEVTRPEPATVLHVFRLGPRGYAHCTVEQARALVAASRYADAVVYATARVRTGLRGVRYVEFDLRHNYTHCYHGVLIAPGARCDACEAEERGG